MRSPLETLRAHYTPQLPDVFKHLHEVHLVESTVVGKSPFLSQHFFHLLSQPIVHFVQGTRVSSPSPLRIGVLLSGGQAPGGHNVIGALFESVKLWHNEGEVVGILHGARGLIENKTLLLTSDIVENYRNLGGFDMIGS